MLATNDVGDSVLSKETEAVTTLQDGEGLGTSNDPGRKQGQTRKYVNIIEEGFNSMDRSISASMFVFFLTVPPFFPGVFLLPVPDEPPVILAVKPTTTTSVLVQWKVF